MESKHFCAFINRWFNLQKRYFPKLFPLDGHGSHLINGTSICVKKNNVHLYCSPPHTNYIFQPPDYVIFHLVKDNFNKIMQYLNLATLGWSDPRNCCKITLKKIFKGPWKSITVALVKKRFQKCGILPLDSEKQNMLELH